MKIYSRVVISMATGEMLESVSTEYHGPIAQLKGGSTTTNTVDKAYNARMATIAEQQQKMAKQYFNFWESDYKPMESAQIQANIGLIPQQAATESAALQTQQAQSQADLGLIPQQAALTSSQIQAQQQLLPEQTALTQEQIQANRGLLPLQTQVTQESLGLQSAQIGAKQELLPAQTQAAAGILQNQITSNAAANPVIQDYYKQALKGIDVNQRVGQARADVAQGFKESDAAIRRNAGRLGLNPASGRVASMLSSAGLNRAKATGAAMTTARNAAEEENFQRVANATKTYKAGLPSI